MHGRRSGALGGGGEVRGLRGGWFDLGGRNRCKQGSDTNSPRSAQDNSILILKKLNCSKSPEEYLGLIKKQYSLINA